MDGLNYQNMFYSSSHAEFNFKRGISKTILLCDNVSNIFYFKAGILAEYFAWGVKSPRLAMPIHENSGRSGVLWPGLASMGLLTFYAKYFPKI